MDFRNNFRVPGPVFLGGKPFNMTLGGWCSGAFEPEGYGQVGAQSQQPSSAIQFSEQRQPFGLGWESITPTPPVRFTTGTKREMEAAHTESIGLKLKRMGTAA
jgi:hypothetical protein